MTTLGEFVQGAHELWPLSGAESWDAPGLTAGLPDWPVRRVLLAVDAVQATVDEARAGVFDLLLTHHPLLLRGVTSVSGEHAKGRLLTTLIQANCALLSAHTNADVADSGASAIIARALGLIDQRAIVPTVSELIGIGRVGQLAQPTTLGQLARTLSALIPSTAGGVRVAGEWNQRIQSVAICSGAGDSLLSEAAVRAADVYITSDLRHHPAQESLESGGPALIDISHWASEWVWCEAAATELRALFPAIDFVVSELRTDPWDAAVLPAERTP